MSIIDQGRGRLAELNGMAAQQMQGLGYYREKDPTVSSAIDAVAALKKRADELRANLAKVAGWQKELARIEKMLAADEP